MIGAAILILVLSLAFVQSKQNFNRPNEDKINKTVVLLVFSVLCTIYDFFMIFLATFYKMPLLTIGLTLYTGIQGFSTYKLFDSYKFLQKNITILNKQFICTNCGMNNNSQSLYCSNCGNEIKTNNVDSSFNLNSERKDNINKQQINANMTFLVISHFLIIVLAFQKWVYFGTLDKVNEVLSSMNTTYNFSTKYSLLGLWDYFTSLYSKINVWGSTQQFGELKMFANLSLTVLIIVIVANLIAILNAFTQSKSVKLLYTISMIASLIFTSIFIYMIGTINEVFSDYSYGIFDNTINVTVVPYLILIFTLLVKIIQYVVFDGVFKSNKEFEDIIHIQKNNKDANEEKISINDLIDEIKKSLSEENIDDAIFLLNKALELDSENPEILLLASSLNARLVNEEFEME